MARVLVISFSVAPGPDRQGVQLVHVLRALSSRFTVDCLTVRDGDLAYVERFHKTRMLRVPMPEGGLGARVEAFRRALRRQLEGAEYDVVHFRDAWSGVPVIERAPALGVKTVFDAGRLSLGEPGPDDAALEAEYRRGEDECLRQADLVLVPHAESHAQVMRRGRTENVVVVPPGVDVDRFDEEAGDAPSDPPRLVYAGGISPGRGVRLLLRAAREVASRTPIKVTLAGPIRRGFSEPLAQAVTQNGLDGSVEILGAIDNEDMPRVIARATVCVAPVAPDHARHPTAPCPTKILEYLACGRSIVAPKRSSVLAVVEDGTDGLLFEPDNPISMADRILRLLGDPALRVRLAQAGRRKVRDHYPASVTRRQLLDAYVRLVPEASWSALTRAAAPPMQGSSFTSTTNSQAELEPVPWDLETEVDDDAGGPPTAITAPAPDFEGSDTGRPVVGELAGEDTARRATMTPAVMETPVEVSERPTGSFLGRDFVAGELQVKPPHAAPSPTPAGRGDDDPPVAPPPSPVVGAPPPPTATPRPKPATVDEYGRPQAASGTLPPRTGSTALKAPPPPPGPARALAGPTPLPRDDTRATLPFVRTSPPPRPPMVDPRRVAPEPGEGPPVPKKR